MSWKTWVADHIAGNDPHPQKSTEWNGGRVVGVPEDFAADSRADVQTPKRGA